LRDLDGVAFNVANELKKGGARWSVKGESRGTRGHRQKCRGGEKPTKATRRGEHGT